MNWSRHNSFNGWRKQKKKRNDMVWYIYPKTRLSWLNIWPRSRPLWSHTQSIYKKIPHGDFGMVWWNPIYLSPPVRHLWNRSAHKVVATPVMANPPAANHHPLFLFLQSTFIFTFAQRGPSLADKRCKERYPPNYHFRETLPRTQILSPSPSRALRIRQKNVLIL